MDQRSRRLSSFIAAALGLAMIAGTAHGDPREVIKRPTTHRAQQLAGGAKPESSVGELGLSPSLGRQLSPRRIGRSLDSEMLRGAVDRRDLANGFRPSRTNHRERTTQQTEFSDWVARNVPDPGFDPRPTARSAWNAMGATELGILTALTGGGVGVREAAAATGLGALMMDTWNSLGEQLIEGAYRGPGLRRANPQPGVIGYDADGRPVYGPSGGTSRDRSGMDQADGRDRGDRSSAGSGAEQGGACDADMCFTLREVDDWQRENGDDGGDDSGNQGSGGDDSSGGSDTDSSEEDDSSDSDSDSSDGSGADDGGDEGADEEGSQPCGGDALGFGPCGGGESHNPFRAAPEDEQKRRRIRAILGRELDGQPSTTERSEDGGECDNPVHPCRPSDDGLMAGVDRPRFQPRELDSEGQVKLRMRLSQEAFGQPVPTD